MALLAEEEIALNNQLLPMALLAEEEIALNNQLPPLALLAEEEIAPAGLETRLRGNRRVRAKHRRTR
jgi:hypothetical protein